MSPQVLQLGVWGQDRGPGPCAVLFGTAEGAPAALPPLKAPSKGLVQMFGRGGLAAPDSGTLKILGVYSWIPAGESTSFQMDSPSPNVFLSPLPTLFPAAESWKEREVPLRDADQAGIPEQREQSQGHPPSVRGAAAPMCAPGVWTEPQALPPPSPSKL